MDTSNSPKRLVQKLSDKALREMEIINSQKRQSDKALKYMLQERSSTSIHARLMRRYLNEVLNPKCDDNYSDCFERATNSAKLTRHLSATAIGIDKDRLAIVADLMSVFAEEEVSSDQDEMTTNSKKLVS